MSEAKIAPGEAQTLDIDQNELGWEVEEPMACFRSASQISVSRIEIQFGIRYIFWLTGHLSGVGSPRLEISP